jgi:hypothetical protein
MKKIQIEPPDEFWTKVRATLDEVLKANGPRQTEMQSNMGVSIFVSILRSYFLRLCGLVLAIASIHSFDLQI